MTRVFIDVFDCRTPSKIFTGKDALKHSLFWIEHGVIARDATQLFRYVYPVKRAVSWHSGVDRNPSRKEFTAEGVHAKMYETEDYLIYASQNNVSSPLFEFAILYEKRDKHVGFFNKTIDRIKKYQSWWRNNR